MPKEINIQCEPLKDNPSLLLDMALNQYRVKAGMMDSAHFPGNLNDLSEMYLTASSAYGNILLLALRSGSYRCDYTGE